jgi:hypothetical protein
MNAVQPAMGRVSSLATVRKRASSFFLKRPLNKGLVIKMTEYRL